MLKVELLKKEHLRDQFDCGVDSLNNYLLRYARQNDLKNISRTFVAVDRNKLIHGFYSINSASVECEDLPENITKQLPRYPIPAARLSRLAVDLKMQKTGLGERLLFNALKRIYLTSNEMGIKIVIVDLLDEKAKSFYESYGFAEYPGQDLKLFLSIETIIQLFS
jgi:N-acetylglutamate synthase-like GNAT family acetyltransferase